MKHAEQKIIEVKVEDLENNLKKLEAKEIM